MPALATITQADIRFRGDWSVVFLPEAASQTFRRNMILTTTSGQVAAALTSNGALTDAVSVTGFAMSDATGVAGTLIPVAIPRNDLSVFSLPVFHATPASAVTANTQVGGAFQGQLQDGLWMVLISGTANPVFGPVEIDKAWPVGEQYGRLWSRFIQSTP